MDLACQSMLLVVLGATGDLTAKKIAPALYLLNQNKKLPRNFKVLGVARRPFSDQEFETYIHSKLKDKLGVTEMDCSFCNHMHYQQSDFNDPESFLKIKDRIMQLEKKEYEYCKIIFYLAIPQTAYANITRQISALGFPKDKISIIYEKPFGHNTADAVELDKNIKECFDEKHIYRIDHYLGKTIVKNISSLRIENPLFASIWKPENITGIEVVTNETKGVEDRGQFYETVGALVDVGQNHLLEMLALAIADEKLLAVNPRRARAEAMQKLPIMSTAEIQKNTERQQYQGYREIDDVDPASTIETHFKIKTYINDPAWKHIPVNLEAGKGLEKVDKRLTVHFKDNSISFITEPEEKIVITMMVRVNGESKPEDFVLSIKNHAIQYVEEYASLFRDIFMDKQDNFVALDEVMGGWRFVDPIISAWKNDQVPLTNYLKGTLPESTL